MILITDVPVHENKARCRRASLAHLLCCCIFTDDTYKTVLHSYNSKQQSRERLKTQVEKLETDTESKLTELDKQNKELNVSIYCVKHSLVHYLFLIACRIVVLTIGKCTSLELLFMTKCRVRYLIP